MMIQPIHDDFRKLNVWRESHEFCLEVYKVTKDFPKAELYCLVSQLRRSSSSIPSNIAESCGKSTNKHKIQTLYVAIGEAKEMEYFLLLSKDLHYIDNKIYTNLNIRLKRITGMLTNLIKSKMGNK